MPIWFWKIMYIPDRFNHLYGIPLIMEVGSLNTKIGFAGKDRPDVIAPSVLFLIYCSMYKLTKIMVKRLSLISFKALRRRVVILKVFLRIVLLMIGRDFRYWRILIWGRSCSWHLRCVLFSILSLLLVVKNIVKN